MGLLKLGNPDRVEMQGGPQLGEGGQWVEPGWRLSWLEGSSPHQGLLVDPPLGLGWEAWVVFSVLPL